MDGRQTARRIRRLGAALRRPEAMVFLPGLSLGAFWFGGERALVALALGLPLLALLTGALRRSGRDLAPSAGAAPLRPGQIAPALDLLLLDSADFGRSTACLVLQADELAAIMTRHGRAALVEVMEQSGARLRGVLRDGDQIGCLDVGGFAIGLAPVRRLDLEALVQMSARLQSALAAPFVVEGAQIALSFSAGFCLPSRAPDRSGQALLEAAQIAADDALRHGPGAIRAFEPGMARIRADRAALRDALEAALDNGEIRAHFQPQICTDTGTISGFEALARWHHPERGLVPPCEFLPLMDEAGLAERLGEVMLFQSLVALSRWDKGGHEVPTVAINLSCAELRNPRLPERIKWELDRFECPPERLTIEVLETVVATTSSDTVARNIAELARLGCRIDLDDFGTGHASITNIRRFPVRRIKIDRSFVTRLDEDRDQQKIVSAILSLAEQLGLDTLAEGVERPAEHAMLAQLGCGHVQGFAIARPMPFEETGDWIARHRDRQASALRIGHRTR